MLKKVERRSSPLRGKYLVRYPGVAYVLGLIDQFLLPLSWLRKRKTISSPKKILLSNVAHLGDFVNATAVLPVLKQAFPDAQIGFLVGSWSLEIAQKHPLIHQIHVVDHWKLNRAKLSFPKKVLHYFKTWIKARGEIRSCNYDISIDLYYYFGNTIPLVTAARVPIRIGYTSGGFGPFLTHAFDWKNYGRSVIDYMRDLLRPLGISDAQMGELRASLPPPSKDIYLYLKERFQLADNYIILHPGTGAAFKEWPLESWKELISLLCSHGYFVVLTGKGVQDRHRNQALVCQGVLDLCDHINWDEFVSLIQHTRCLIGVDSLAGHVAAVCNTPSILIYSGINHPREWAPKSPLAQVLSHGVPCSPCYLRKGCKNMSCIRLITPKYILDRLNDLLTPNVHFASRSEEQKRVFRRS